MKRFFSFVMICLVVIILSSCTIFNDKNDLKEDDSSNSDLNDDTDSDNENDSVDFELPSDTNIDSSDYDDSLDIVIDLSSKTITNNNGFVSFSDDTLFILESGSYILKGVYEGRIVCNKENGEIDLSLEGVNITCSTNCPIVGLDLDKFKVTAKKDTLNYISDTRVEEGSYNSIIYSNCDTSIKGKGYLELNTTLNNGVHSKKDLEIKNLSLKVTAINNAIKGNDSVSIDSATITAISISGDTIKTTDSDISSKGNQRGMVDIVESNVTLYACCDGIDASYDVHISSNTILNIYTSSYSAYSSYINSTSDDLLYIKLQGNITSAYITFTLNDNSTKKVTGSSVSSGMNNRIFKYEIPSDVLSFVVTITYNNKEYSTDSMNLNSSYDCLSISLNRNTFTASWTTYKVENTGGMFGGMGMGGMEEGNTNKAGYSCKGIKSDNEIYISGGDIYIESYDDGMHADNKTTLENGSVGLGNINISGGNIFITSKDDGIHADNKLTINGGVINILESYEGLEGKYVLINDGDISIISSDDGINGTTTSGYGIEINGGSLYVYACGDGLDSNSTSKNQGILFSGGRSVIICNSNGNSAIDTENGYSHTGGYVLAIMTSGGMTNETTNGTYTSMTKKSISLINNYYVYVSVSSTIHCVIKMPVSMSSYVVYLGSSSASISSSSSTSYELTNNMYWGV